MSKCSGEHQHSWGKEGHAHGHGTMWYEGDPNKLHHHHDIICLRAKDAEIASLRAEIGNSEAVRLGMEKKIADLKDGLTAAHMDGFASGKAEATEMLRKREGQLEELRAEVKAYREVEDSLQKEIKRLDKEVASLTQELEEARSMIQWERGAKNGAYELIEQQDKLKAENAALREEVERLADVKTLIQEYPLTAAGMVQLRSRVTELEGELAPLRKVVGTLTRSWGGWVITSADVERNNLDVEALQKGVKK